MWYHQKAFVLVTTLWVLAILAIAISFFALWTQRTITLAQKMQDNLQGEIDMHSTQANIIYLLTTQRMTIAGLTVPPKKELDATKTLDELKDEFTQQQNNSITSEGDSILPIGGEIFLDDSPYFGHGKAYFALQDIGGLIPINLVSAATLNQLLGFLGVDIELRPPLIAKFYDYIDTDDLHRLNGAEAYHYEKRDLLPPTNHFLINPMESQRILDWTEQSLMWENNRIGQLTNTVLPAMPNFNTAPSLVLQAAYNITADGAKSLTKFRRTVPFYTLNKVNQMAGVHLNVDPMEANFFPSHYLRLTLWYEDAQRMRQVQLKLTHNVDGYEPWLIDYTLEWALLPDYTKKNPIHAQTTVFNSTLFSP
ncbi:hypothetical protein [Candidatus Parabeggiatoa sp. HSG14]|uniref:general secretion pathway protein GspK n=1 Tax=Candidatus Parabeggiatoa sp. HSG14 TaxID=3055593 RepID=UPI0025A8FAFD|nr:type II secretion system protein GspK [Thiotrichales bacterium HSG14]